MSESIRQTVRVAPGQRVELQVPTLTEGDLVDVVVTPRAKSPLIQGNIVDFLNSLPPGPRCFANWDEYDRFLESEKNNWDK